MSSAPQRIRGVLDMAADREQIESFLVHQVESGKQKHDPEQYAEMEAYLNSEEYPADLERLKKGDYFFPAPFHYRITKTRPVKNGMSMPSRAGTCMS